MKSKIFRIGAFLLGLSNFIYGGLINHNWIDGIFGFLLIVWGVNGVTASIKTREKSPD